MRDRLKYHGHWLLVGVLLIGAAVRWLHIGSHSFWYDEALSNLIASLTPAQIFANVASSDHPPGYYLMLHFWQSVGTSEFTIRSLSAIFSLAAIGVVYAVGRRRFGRTTAALAAVGMALAPFQVYYAQEARMYGMVIFFAAATTWLFFEAIELKGNRFAWAAYGIVSTCGLYLHYYTAFLLLGLHVWFILHWKQNRAVLVHLLSADALISLLFLPQMSQALTRTTAYLGGVAWQTTPSLLSPFTTIFYLLFAHRSPLWMVPIGMYLSLAVLALVLLEIRRRPNSEGRWETALWLSVFTPIAIVMLVSWGIRPIYLERSFAVCTPALMLLLARGGTTRTTRSPVPFVLMALALPITVTLLAHLTTLDPAKPPIREAAQAIGANYRSGDVSLHLQDASCIPSLWYAPNVKHLTIDIPNAIWTPQQTHQLFGGGIAELESTLAGAKRLWLTVMPGYMSSEQWAIWDCINGTYPQVIERNWGAVQLQLYDLADIEIPDCAKTQKAAQ
jgi:uncharacterized membrane protein